MDSGNSAFDSGKAQQFFQAFAYDRKEHVASGTFARTDSAHLGENGGGGVALNHWHRDDLAPGGFHFFPANNLIAWPVAALDEHVWQKRCDDLAWRQLVKDDHGVDTLKRRQDLCPFKFRKN